MNVSDKNSPSDRNGAWPVPDQIGIFLHHIYAFKKGVRNLVLHTIRKKHESFAVRRLQNQQLSYWVQQVCGHTDNLYVGKKGCMNAIRMFIDRPLNQLTPGKDIILGPMLGYDMSQQYKRFCDKKRLSELV